MSSQVDICNMALAHLGVGATISAIDERSAEARACTAFYDLCRNQVFRDFPWPFASKQDALALVEEFDGETLRASEWAYSYRYPADALVFRRILSGSRQDTRDSLIPYRLLRDDDGALILTDVEDAEGEWTVVVENPEEYPPDFVVALSYLLAFRIAPLVTKGDQFRLGAQAGQLYLREIAIARANAANEEKADIPPDSEFIRGRA